MYIVTILNPEGNTVYEFSDKDTAEKWVAYFRVGCGLTVSIEQKNK